ncbi:hypothetical protein D3C76_728990 [compost metagenome]
MLAADQLGQVFGFLLVGAIAVDLVDAQVGVGTVGEGDRGRAAADFFHGHHVGQVAQAGAAVFFRYGNAQQAHVTELAPHVGGEQVFLVDLRGAGGQFGGDKGLDLVAQHVDGFAQGEVQGRVIHACTFAVYSCGRGEQPWLILLSPLR